MPSWLTAELGTEIARGVLVTIALTLTTSVTSFVAGLAAAMGRRSRNPWRRRVAAIYVELFRNVPSLILLIFFAFAVPNLFPADVRRTLFFNNWLVDAIGDITTLPLP